MSDNSDASPPGGDWGGSLELAKKAADYAHEALETVVGIMRAPTRSAQNQLQAARMILEMAKELPPQQAATTPASLDDLAAARERLRQARLAERRGK